MKRFFNWFHKKNNSTSLTTEKLVVLLEKLAQTEAHEISCDDVQDVLAEFAEMQRYGEDIAHLMPLVHKHLEMCKSCQEEYEALMLALDAENLILSSDQPL